MHINASQRQLGIMLQHDMLGLSTVAYMPRLHRLVRNVSNSHSAKKKHEGAIVIWPIFKQPHSNHMKITDNT